MARRKKNVVLSEEQKRKNEKIFARLNAEREKLYDDTRLLQQNWRERRAERLAGRGKRRKERGAGIATD